MKASSFSLFSASRNLAIWGCSLACWATSSWASHIDIIFEERPDGTLVSYSSSIDLNDFGPSQDLSRLLFATEEDPFYSGILSAPFLFTQLTFEVPGQPLQEAETRGTFFFNANPQLQTLNFINVGNATGDSFGVSLAGSDVPFLSIYLPTNYTSGDPLSGSVFIEDLSREQVVGLTGTYALDFEGAVTISFRTLPEVPIVITAFSFDPLSNIAMCEFTGEAGITYESVFSSELDFNDPELLDIEEVFIGEEVPLSGNGGLETDESGQASFSINVPDGEKGFIRIRPIFMPEDLL